MIQALAGKHITIDKTIAGLKTSIFTVTALKADPAVIQHF